ncbi:hypothetical protein AAMO2058_000948600 [Amorphochlora amoebiformis]
MELPANVPSLVRNRTTQDPHGNNDTEPNPDAKQNEGTSENKQHNKNAISDQGGWNGGLVMVGVIAVALAVIIKGFNNTTPVTFGEPFDKSLFTGYLQAETLGRSIRHLRKTTSTMDDAAQLLESLTPQDAHGYTVIADVQTKARGRKGRKWHASSIDNLYASFLWVPSQVNNPPSSRELPHHLVQLNVAVCLAVALALEREGAPNVGVKWPNDVWIDGKKAAGVLVDYHGKVGSSGAVVGVGINVNEELVDRSVNIKSSVGAISLRDAVGSGVSRERVLAVLLTELEYLMSVTFETVLGKYQELDIVSGNQVKVHFKSREISDPRDFQGTAIGLTHDGRLKVQDSKTGTEFLLASEEVSITPMRA